jgi:hypothetical protein
MFREHFMECSRKGIVLYETGNEWDIDLSVAPKFSYETGELLFAESSRIVQKN